MSKKKIEIRDLTYEELLKVDTSNMTKQERKQVYNYRNRKKPIEETVEEVVEEVKPIAIKDNKPGIIENINNSWYWSFAKHFFFVAPPLLKAALEVRRSLKQQTETQQTTQNTQNTLNENTEILKTASNPLDW